MEKDEIKVNPQNIIRAILLAIWSLFLLWLYFSTNLNLFIEKRYLILSLLAGVILFILSLIQVRRLKILHYNHLDSKTISCAHSVHHKIRDKDIFICLLFVFPIILYFVINPRGLGSFAAGKRGVDLNIEISKNRILNDLQFQIEKESKYQKLNLLQLLLIAQNKPQDACQMHVSTVGFVYKDETMETNQFGLLRFHIVCCAACAQPVGVLVESEDAVNFQNDQWVSVKGRVQIRKKDDKEFCDIIAEKIETVSKPDNPYVY